MAEDHDFKVKKALRKDPADMPHPPPSPAPDLYDPQVLREVTAELEAEERQKEPGEPAAKDPAEWIELPELPPAPPQVSPAAWFLRQAKRLLVIIGVIYLAVWAVRALRHKDVDFQPVEMKAGSVPLPRLNQAEAKADQALTEALNDARGDLASADLNSGVKALEDLAQKHPDTVQGRKAMLTLAATYRFQLNQPDQAIQWYKSYLDSDPAGKEAPATMVRLADFLESLGRKSEAHSVYEDFLNRFPKKPQAEIAKQGLERTK
jgi:TolA-binding protein